MLAALLVFGCARKAPDGGDRTLSVSFTSSASDSALDGRLLLLLSDDPSAEPRFQINTGLNTQMIFGQNVEGMQPGESVAFNTSHPGFPYEGLAGLQPAT